MSLQLNSLGSKANDAITGAVMVMKSGLQHLREQAQDLEGPSAPIAGAFRFRALQDVAGRCIALQVENLE